MTNTEYQGIQTLHSKSDVPKDKTKIHLWTVQNKQKS